MPKEQTMKRIRAVQAFTLKDGTTLFPVGAVGEIPSTEAEALVKEGKATWVETRGVEAAPKPQPGA